MTNEKHTPGPWKTRGPQSNFQKGNLFIYPIQPGTTIFPDTERLIATASGKSRRYEETQANARLIAAAPELLAALEELVRFVPDYLFHANKWPDVDFDVGAELFSARAAIAKATGDVNALAA